MGDIIIDGKIQVPADGFETVVALPRAVDVENRPALVVPVAQHLEDGREVDAAAAQVVINAGGRWERNDGPEARCLSPASGMTLPASSEANLLEFHRPRFLNRGASVSSSFQLTRRSVGPHPSAKGAPESLRIAW